MILSLYLGGCFAPQDPLTIAVSLGMDEPIYIGVDQAIKGIEEYVKEVNQAGGVNGKKLKIELFNDSNDPEKALIFIPISQFTYSLYLVSNCCKI